MLKKQRKESGLSQQELALKLGVKAGQVAQLEGDRGPRPSFQLLGRVAEVLGLDKDQLFQLAESGRRSPGARGSIFRPANRGRVWGAFTRDRALLDRHNVKARELKTLSEVSLMGKVTRSETLLFILDAIRQSGDTEE
jgi:transcriptional regulator with XRE-family HTH domain